MRRGAEEPVRGCAYTSRQFDAQNPFAGLRRLSGVGHLPGWDYFFQTFLPFGHGVSPPGEVWDACAARSKVGPVMGLRPPI